MKGFRGFLMCWCFCWSLLAGVVEVTGDAADVGGAVDEEDEADEEELDALDVDEEGDEDEAGELEVEANELGWACVWGCRCV